MIFLLVVKVRVATLFLSWKLRRIEEIWGEISIIFEEIWKKLVQNLRRIEETFFIFTSFKTSKTALLTAMSGNYFQPWMVTKYQLTVKEFTITKILCTKYSSSFFWINKCFFLAKESWLFCGSTLSKVEFEEIWGGFLKNLHFMRREEIWGEIPNLRRRGNPECILKFREKYFLSIIQSFTKIMRLTTHFTESSISYVCRMVNFMPQSLKAASKQKPHRGLGTRLPSSW